MPDEPDQAASSTQPPAAAGADSSLQPASDAAPKNTPQDAQATPAAASQPNPQKEQGSVPQASQPAPRPLETYQHVTTRARGAGGRFEPVTAEPPKSAVSAVLKPLVARTYDEEGANALAPKGGISGLDDIPKKWPELPGNVSLGQEIAWVQSERLRVVKELPSGRMKVYLSKARVPAPSMSALSWLETSIRSYAKFVEVASKQASSGQDEAEFIRRERMQVGEIRSILEEMRVDKVA